MRGDGARAGRRGQGVPAPERAYRLTRFRGTSTSASTVNGLGICEQALATDGGDISIKTAAARAYGASGQREKEIVLLREMGAQDNAEALLDIYYMHNSFDRGHPERPQIVKRAEAEQSLRKAAELGNPAAILRLATLLERGNTVKRDNAEAIRWTEQAINNPAKDWRPIDMQVRLGRLLAKSDNSTEKVRGIALLEKLRAGRTVQCQDRACGCYSRGRSGACSLAIRAVREG